MNGDDQIRMYDFKASNMLWKAYCNKTDNEELGSVELQLFILRNCLSKYPGVIT